jgi:hypothetical protein
VPGFPVGLNIFKLIFYTGLIHLLISLYFLYLGFLKKRLSFFKQDELYPLSTFLDQMIFDKSPEEMKEALNAGYENFVESPSLWIPRYWTYAGEINVFLTYKFIVATFIILFPIRTFH